MPFIIISAVVAILVAILAIQNSMMVDLTLFMWSFRLNLVLVVLLSVICGLLLGLAWGITVKTRGMWRMRKLNEQIALLEDDKRILRDKVEQLRMRRRRPAVHLVTDKKIINSKRAVTYPGRACPIANLLGGDCKTVCRMPP